MCLCGLSEVLVDIFSFWMLFFFGVNFICLIIQVVVRMSVIMLINVLFICMSGELVGVVGWEIVVFVFIINDLNDVYVWMV